MKTAALRRPTSLETAVTDLLHATGLLVRRVRIEANTGDLSLSQSSALARLERHGSMTIADLARAESVKPQSMGATLLALETWKLVERRRHPTDGRQVLFALTDSGLQSRRARSTLKRRWLSQAMAKLDAGERETIVKAAALIKRLAES